MADTKIIVNCETGEVQELALSPEEIKQREADALAIAEAKAEEEAAQAAKEAKRDAIFAALAEAAGLEVSDVLDVLA